MKGGLIKMGESEDESSSRTVTRTALLAVGEELALSVQLSYCSALLVLLSPAQMQQWPCLSGPPAVAGEFADTATVDNGRAAQNKACVTSH